MVEITGQAQYEAWRRRDLPQVEEVRPRLWSFPVEMIGNPLRYVLCYAVIDGPEVVLVDPGWPSDASWASLTRHLGGLGITAADVTGVLVTHAHPDHLGLAPRLREASGCWVAMHSLEQAELQRHRTQPVKRDWHRRCGIPDAMVRARVGDPSLDLDFEADILLDDHDRAPVKSLEVRTLWTPGHTPGHVCFVAAERDVILTGDHVLPRISPSIAAFREGGPDILGNYLHSLRTVAEYDAEALPGHEYRFRGLRQRTEDLRRHHDARLAEILHRLADGPGASAWDVASSLTWSRPWDHYAGYMLISAVGETFAHLQHLRAAGLVQCTDGTPARWQLTTSAGA